MTFEMGSRLHYLFIASPFLMVIFMNLGLKNQSFEQKRKWGVALSWVALLLLMLRNIEILVKNGWVMDAEVIPLQICHFANFVLLLAFMKNNKTLFSLAFCLNLPAAMMSIIFANSLENYSTLLTFRAQAYLWGHMLIVGLTLFALTQGFISIDKKRFLKTLGLMVVLYLSALIISNGLSVIWGLDANYFYTIKPENGTPLELFYTMGKTLQFQGFEVNPLYLLLTALLGGVVVSVFYGMYHLATLRWPLLRKDD